MGCAIASVSTTAVQTELNPPALGDMSGRGYECNFCLGIYQGQAKDI
jgi:hypothetical protein